MDITYIILCEIQLLHRFTLYSTIVSMRARSTPSKDGACFYFLFFFLLLLFIFLLLFHLNLSASHVTFIQIIEYTLYTITLYTISYVFLVRTTYYIVQRMYIVNLSVKFIYIIHCSRCRRQDGQRSVVSH